MPGSEKRSIQELVARYELEPGLRDIFVEGPEDKIIIEGILQENKIERVCIFEISSVDVPTEPGEETNNRTRLIKLARHFADALRGRRFRIVCVVDSDFDYLTGHQENNSFLLKTDYANMEMYFFSDSIFKKINTRCLRGKFITPNVVNRFMVPTLQALFLIRFVNFLERYKMVYLPFDRLLSFSGGTFRFDKNEYVRRYLNKNSRSAELGGFIRKIGTIQLPANMDPRCFMHGHDYCHLLRRMINLLRGANIYDNEEAVYNLVRACAEYDKLSINPMFSAIFNHLL